MDRLLSERAVIEALQNRIGESIIDCIKAIPSAEPTIDCNNCQRECPKWAEKIAKANGCVGYIPSAEPKTGHWSRKTKVDAYDIAGVKTWGIKCQCDRCDFTTIVVEDFGYYKYCPNCGCRMVEPQESEG